MRIIKEPEERKNEILDTAERLFETAGYEKTTVNNILNAIGIAKGTFYYYFKSKEEVLDAIVMRHIQRKARIAEDIAAQEGLNAAQKLSSILFAQKPGTKAETGIIARIHKNENALLHQKAMQKTICHLAPVFAKVLEQGIGEKLFSMHFPKETAEILLMSQYLFDDGIFQWTPEELSQKILAFIHAMELLLGADKGTFNFITELIGDSFAKGDD